VDRPPGTEARARAGDAPRVARPGRVVGAVSLLGLAVVASTLAGPWDPPIRHTDTNWTAPPAPTTTPHPLIPDEFFENATPVTPWDLRWLGTAVVLAIVAWVVYLVLSWFRRHPPPRPPEAPDDAGIELDGAVFGPGTVLPDLPSLRAGVVEAEAALRRFARPVDAVIAAWVRLEAAAARSGVVRDPASTPTEFTVRVLDTAPVDPQATRTLLDLYLRARFGSERMTADDVAAAVGALTVLALGLGDPEDADTSGWRIGRTDDPVRDMPPDDDGRADT